MKNKGKNLFIISGPSGAGEDSVIEGLKKFFAIERVKTTTTRKMRPCDSQGNPYYFISEEEFKKRLKNNEFIEFAKEYNDQLYGTSIKELERVKESGKVGVWKIEYKGVRIIKKKLPKIKAIFIAPPSLEILRKRLEKRGGLTAKEIDERMEYTKKWMKHEDIYDYKVINEEGRLDKTIITVKRIIEKKIAGRRKKTIAIFSSVLAVFVLVLLATIFAPGLIRKRQLEKEFQIFSDYLEAVPGNAVWLVASTNGVEGDFWSRALGQKGFLFIDQDNDSALIIKNNDQAVLTEMIKKFWGYKYPSQRVFSLPDGSYAYEYFSNPDKFAVESSELLGVKVDSIIDNGLGIQMSWATFSGLSVVSIKIASIKNAIERSKSAEKIDLERLDTVNCSEINKKLDEKKDLQALLTAQGTDSEKLVCFQID